MAYNFNHIATFTDDNKGILCKLRCTDTLVNGYLPVLIGGTQAFIPMGGTAKAGQTYAGVTIAPDAPKD